MIVLDEERRAAAKSFTIFTWPILSLMLPSWELFCFADDCPVRQLATPLT